MTMRRKIAKIRKKAAHLDSLRRKAAGLFQLLTSSEEDHAREAILAYKELWEETRTARFASLGFALDESAPFPMEWETKLNKQTDALAKNKCASTVIRRMTKDGHANLFPEMEG